MVPPRAAARSPGAGTILRVTGMVWRVDRAGFALAVGLACVSAAAGLAVVFVGQLALSALVTGGAAGSLVLALVLLAVVTTVAAAVGVVQTQRQRVLGELLTQDVWGRINRRVAVAEPLDFETPGFTTALERVSQNAVIHPYNVTVGLLGLLGGVLGLVTLGGALLALHPLLPAVLLVAGLPTFIIGRRASRTEFDHADEITRPFRLRAYVRELLQLRRYAGERIAVASEEALLDRHAALDAAILRALRWQVFRRERYGLLSALVGGVSLTLALLGLVYLVRAGSLTVAQAGAGALAVRLLSGQLTTVYASVGSLQESMPFLHDLEEFTTVPPSARSAGRRLELRRGLRVRDVGFRYPGQEAWALEGVSLNLTPGRVVALVGENGSGKTTLAKIIAGLYPPTTGSLTWDDAGVAAEDLRQSVSLLLQDFIRYQFTVAENVGMGEPSAPPDGERTDLALKGARAGEFVGELPQGAETVLGRDLDEGTDLSGGQWQRIALARALYRDRALMVLDEPTAALDPRAEHELFNDVRLTLAGRAALIVSHRYLSVRMADEILVLHAGHVVERGTHAQLLALGGRYAELFRLQSAGFSLDENDPSAGL